VEIPAPRRHVLMELADPVDDRHGLLLRPAAPARIPSRPARALATPCRRRPGDWMGGVCAKTKGVADG
jgi:hypothetical protein